MPAFTDFQHSSAFGQLNAFAISTRITKGNRPRIIRGGRGHHMHQFSLIRGRHHHHSGQIAQIGHIKTASMRGAICPHQTGAINRETHRQILDRHIMHDLIISALQKGRIHRAKRPHAASRQSSGKSHPMLFCNAHIKTARRVTLRKQV